MDHHGVEGILDLVGNARREPAELGQLGRIADQRLERLHRLQILEERDGAARQPAVRHEEAGGEQRPGSTLGRHDDRRLAHAGRVGEDPLHQRPARV